VDAFELNQRVTVTNVGRIATSRGEDAARWLLDRPGVVLALAKDTEGAWVRLDEALPPALRGHYPDKHPLGRNVLLFPWECEPAHDRRYAPFHIEDFQRAVTAARYRFDDVHLWPPAVGRPREHSWWLDVTDEVRESSGTGVWEYVLRFGVARRPVSLLIYTSVSTTTSWSRPASKDAIRFVHELRNPPVRHLDTGAMVRRTGSEPLERVTQRILELLAPDRVRQLQQHTWSATPWRRSR